MNKQEVIDGYIEDSLTPEQYYTDHYNSAYLVLGGLARIYNSELNSRGVSSGNGAEEYRLNSWVESEYSKEAYALALPSAKAVYHDDLIRPVFYTINRKEREVISETGIVLPTESSLINDLELTINASNVLYDIFSHDDLQIMLCLIQKARRDLKGSPKPIDYGSFIAISSHKLDELSKIFPSKDRKKDSDSENIEQLTEKWLDFEKSANHLFKKKAGKKLSVTELAVIHEIAQDKTCAIKLTGTSKNILMAEIVVQHGNEVESQNYIFSSALSQEDMEDSYDYAPNWNFEDLHEALELGNHVSPEEFTTFHAETLDANTTFNSNLLFDDNVIDINRDAA